VTVIFFAGPRLDHGDADLSSGNEADYLERRDARPPVVVRGYGVSGHPVSVIRAGERVEDATLATAKDLEAYGFDPISLSKYWLFPARDAYGNATTGASQKYNTPGQLTSGSDNQGFAPPFSFRPHAVLPMPNGWLFCLAAPLPNTWDLALGGRSAQFQFSGVFREYYRVYRRNGDWVQDFPDLHGAPIHDVHWDDDGNCFVAGDEVGEERYSFRKYNSAYELQWSVSFKDYWPLSTVAVRTAQRDFERGRAQFGQRRASVRIEPAGDGSFYVLSEIAVTNGYMRGAFRYYRRKKQFTQISKVSAAGALVWTRLLETTVAFGEPTRNRFTCKALGAQFFVFFREEVPVRYSVGESGGDYSWDKFMQVFKEDQQWTYQELFDYYYEDRLVPQNGMKIGADGTLNGFLFPSSSVLISSVTTSQGVVLESRIYPNQLLNCVMRYADERMTVWSRRIQLLGSAGEIYNIPPRFIKYVFFKDLTLLSEDETASFNHLDAVAIAEDGSIYRGTRDLKVYPQAFQGIFVFPPDVIVAMHFKAVDADGNSLWDGITATAQLGLNSYGKLWRDLGRWRIVSDEPRAGGLTPDAALIPYQTAHDDFAVFTNAHGALTSGDFVALSGFQSSDDFWLPATDIVIAYDSPPPALALPVFLKRPLLIGPVNSLPPGLALPLGLGMPVLRREYVGPPLPQVYRLTLGNLELPFSTLIVRKTTFEVTVSAVCPAASEALVAAVIARDTETLTVWRGVKFLDGTEQRERMIGGAPIDIRYDRGARSGSLTLSLRLTPAGMAARSRTLAAVSRRDARAWSSPLPDIFLNPGDTAVVGAFSFTVGSVDYLINPNEARMTVGEAAA
jgi:hypothetical protein